MLESIFTKLRQYACLSAATCCVISTVEAGLFCHWCVEPMRPYCTPTSESNWGIQQTRWRRFPDTSNNSGAYCSACEGAPGAYDTSGMQMPQQWSGTPPKTVFDRSQLPPGAIVLPPAQSSNFNPPTGSLPGPTTTQMYAAPTQGVKPYQPGPPQSAPMQPLAAPQQAPIPQPSSDLPLPAPMPMQPAPMPRLPAPTTITPQPAAPSIEMPPVPGQAVVPYPPNTQSVDWNGQNMPVHTVPYTTDQGQHNRMYRGGFVYARRSGPVPGYQPPRNLGATPLMQNDDARQTQPVSGVSFQQAAGADSLNQAPQPRWKRFLKLPRLTRLKQ